MPSETTRRSSMEPGSWQRRATTVSLPARAQRVVDLVKIRRKAKEKLAKELAGESGGTAALRETEQAPAPDLPAAIVPPDGSSAERALPTPAAGPASPSVEGQSDVTNREGQRDRDLLAALRTSADA